MKKNGEDLIPRFDLPVDMLVDDNIDVSILDSYVKYPCKINAAVFALCISGEIEAMVFLNKIMIHPGDAVLLIPGSIIQITRLSPDTKISFMGFSSAFISKVYFWKKISGSFTQIIRNPVVQMEPGQFSIYKGAFSLLSHARKEESVKMSNAIEQAVADLLMQVLLELYKVEGNERIAGISRDQEVLGYFLQYAFKYYASEHKVSFYADKVGLSLSHFCSVIHNVSGSTPQAIIKDLIILDAKTQLKNTTLPINKIGMSLGFPTATTFSRYFRKYVGTSPVEYRNS